MGAKLIINRIGNIDQAILQKSRHDLQDINSLVAVTPSKPTTSRLLKFAESSQIQGKAERKSGAPLMGPTLGTPVNEYFE